MAGGSTYVNTITMEGGMRIIRGRGLNRRFFLSKNQRGGRGGGEDGRVVEQGERALLYGKLKRLIRFTGT